MAAAGAAAAAAAAATDSTTLSGVAPVCLRGVREYGCVMDRDPVSRMEELDRLSAEWRGCEQCALAATRTQVVVGRGNPRSSLMFVGEAPGFHEDKQGLPFVGQAGKLLDTLLGEVGIPSDGTTSPTSSSAGRRATAIRSPMRSPPARATCSSRSS